MYIYAIHVIVLYQLSKKPTAFLIFHRYLFFKVACYCMYIMNTQGIKGKYFYVF